MAVDDKSLSLPQSGMNRDKHPSFLSDQEYTFAMNANIESEDGNIGMRSNEHSNLKCIGFEDYKVIGYKNDLSSGFTYFFVTNPIDKTSKILYLKSCDDIALLNDSQIQESILGNIDICSGMKILIEDHASDPCLRFSMYYPIKTIEIKTEKCGRCIYWTDDYNPPRYIIVDKALIPDEDGDIWYHYHGYKMCGDGKSREDFIKENGCFIACEKLRIFPLLEQPRIDPESIAYGGSLRAGVYQFAVALCDEFGNEKTNYSEFTNPVHIFDEHDITIKDGKWGERTNMGIRLVVDNIDMQVNYFKIVVIQNTVGYNGETQAVVDYFIEGIHPVTEKTIYYYSDLNNKRTTLEHISYRRPIYNTSRGIASVGNKLLQYGLTAEKEWNLQPVVSFMGHFLKWQSSVSTGDLYKDGNACSLYVGYMRDEVYPFGIRFNTKTGYKTPVFTLIPAPYSDARKLASEVPSLTTPVSSITRYVSNCQSNDRKYAWQYMNTSDNVKDASILNTEIKYLYEEARSGCSNQTTIKQTIISGRVISEKPFSNIEFEINDSNIVDIERYLSDNILDISCQNSSNPGMKAICDFVTAYNSAEGNHDIQFPMDGIAYPEVPEGCGKIHRQESRISVPFDRIEGANTTTSYVEFKNMLKLTDEYIPNVSSEYSSKQNYIFDSSAYEQFEAYSIAVWTGKIPEEAIDRRSPSVMIKAVAGMLKLYETYSGTCGKSISNACNPLSLNGVYDSIQSTPVNICSYIEPENAWCKSEGSGSETAYNDCMPFWGGDTVLDANLKPKTEELINEKLSNSFDTGLSTSWSRITYDLASGNADEYFAMLKGNKDANIQMRAGYQETKFYSKLGINALWIKVSKPESWSNPEYEGEKVVYLECFGKGDFSKIDFGSSDLVRISYWKDSAGTPINEDLAGLKEKAKYSSSNNNSFVVDVDSHFLVELKESTFNRHGVNSFYISIDSPVLLSVFFLSSRKNDSEDYSWACVGGSSILGRTVNPYVVTVRDKEISGYKMTAKKIYLESSVTFVTECISCGDKPINCAPRPHTYGDFAYFESSHKYPSNYELWDSSRMRIDLDRSYSDPDKTNALSEIESNMKKWYGNPIRDSSGKYYYKGHKYGTYDSNTVFCQQPIRHYRFPDNFHAQFINGDLRSVSDNSEIYPVGILINEAILNVFLDYAVDSGLISMDQRESICGYDIYRGDRMLNKSVVGCGLGYDFFKYTDKEGQVNIYPNYPYNDLGDDIYHYSNGRRNEFISHPFDKSGNVWYSFISPDIFFNKPVMADEITLDGYMRGMSTGCFANVEDHPKWTILSDKAYRMAKTLASVESIAQLMGEIMEDYQLVVIGSSGGILGTGIGAGTALGALGFAAGAVFKLAHRAAYYGKYLSDWINTFTNNGPRYNFAYYYSSIGQYTSMFALQDHESYIKNSIRGLSMCKMIKSGIIPVNDESNNSVLYINNLYRESSMFMSLGDPGSGASGQDYKTVYPTIVKAYDTSRVSDQCIMIDEQAVLKTSELTKQMSYIASPYIRAKIYKPNQYGDIEDIKWVSVGGTSRMGNKYRFLFGGDTFISKFAIKRKLPEFYNNAFRIGDMIPFSYDDYRNIGFPRFVVNFDTGQTEGSYTDNETFRGQKSKYAGSSYFYPYKYSLYNLNGKAIDDKYVMGRFYLWFYGIPEFYVESDINCNVRLKGIEPYEQFYPDMQDFMKWTQENHVSIERDNDYKISPIYHSRGNITPNVLPATYDKRFYDCAYQRPNGVIWSVSDISENSQTDPWLTYKPMDYHEFPSKNGKLIHMKRIESDQIMARFEDQVSIHNAVDVIKERLQSNQPEIGTGGLFASRPMEYNTTDLGYSGTQSTEMISCEFGHFWVDAKRGQVFMTDPSGKGLVNVSKGIEHWLKNHLPFKILKYDIVNADTESPMTYEDVDNKFVGLGLSLGWDNRYKRLFITKKDYIPVSSPAYYKYKKGKFFYNDREVSLKDQSFFKDVSFTLAYSCKNGEWISYYSFCPDYYIEQQQFFQTGLNFSSTSKEIGLWSHLLTNKSFQSFYGTTYPFIIEVPVKEKFNGSILASVEYEMDARKYEDDVNYSVDRQVGMDSLIVYNDTNNSGEIRLVPEQKNNLLQKVSYPKIKDGYTEVLDTEVYRRHKVNDFFNRVDDDRSFTPIWIKDDNDINKEVDISSLNFRKKWQDRIRGSWLLMRMKKMISNRKIIFQWLISESKQDNR